MNEIIRDMSYDALRLKLQDVRETIAIAQNARTLLENELIFRNKRIEETLGSKAASLITLEKRGKLDAGLQAAALAEST